VGCCIPGVGLKSAGKFPLWHIPQCILDNNDGTYVQYRYHCDRRHQS
jgi:hypothetical protein